MNGKWSKIRKNLSADAHGNLASLKTLNFSRYRKVHFSPDSPEEFELPFSGKLSPNNRWVILAELIPWEEFETEYAKFFSSEKGAPAKVFRMALGALMIKEKLGTSDRETVEQIKENPYLQYFIGLDSTND